MRFRNDTGLALIELLIIVTIIGLIAAIAIPNMPSAINSDRQKRTICARNFLQFGDMLSREFE